MSPLPRTLARVLAAGLGVPLLSCVALVLAAPSLLDDDATSAAVSRAAAAGHAARSLAAMGLAGHLRRARRRRGAGPRDAA